MTSKAIKNKAWLLEHGHTVVHQLTAVGYRAVDVESGLFVCSSCNDLLNQECRAPYSPLCPPCAFQTNATRMLAQLNPTQPNLYGLLTWRISEDVVFKTLFLGHSCGKPYCAIARESFNRPRQPKPTNQRSYSNYPSGVSPVGKWSQVN